MRSKSWPSPQRHPKYEPLYLVDSNGATIEVFFADHVFYGMRCGWYWWKGRPPGGVPEWPPVGPFGTAYRAHWDALTRTSAMRP